MYQVEVRNDIAYTVCWTSGFRIIDVSNPAAPVELAVDDSYNVWKLDVGGSYAYVVELYLMLIVIYISMISQILQILLK